MPYFYDPADFDWAQEVIKRYPDIRREWDRYPQFLRRPRYKLYLGRPLELNKNEWDMVGLMVKGRRSFINSLVCPKTWELTKILPIKDNLGFSVFYPGMETVKHNGWSKDIVRCQLGIDMNEQSSLHCGTDSRSLRNGEMMIFEDSEEHWAYNHGNRERTVLIFDLLKRDIGLA
jgi:aspartyl/asparaginyl beta-hydroxylase (cupin superfamily)